VGADGRYQIANLRPGFYIVTENQPIGYISTSPNLVIVQVRAGEETVVNFGEIAWLPRPTATPTASATPTPTMTPTTTPSLAIVEGFVWEDQNRDGQHDPNDPGIAGLTITLRGATAQHRSINETRVTITDASGHYEFTHVTPGDYVIQTEVPPRYWPTTSSSVTITLTLQQTAEINFGLYRALVIQYLPIIRSDAPF
jgi:serine-aspartate repeat-containing protein C/D/E